MKPASGFTNTARFSSRRTVVQRATGGTSVEPAPTQARTTSRQVDLEELVERVYQRWQDEIRRERERGGW